MRLAVAAMVLVCATSARAGGLGAIVIPPAEVDYGAGPTLGAAPALVGTSQELLVGMHWASLYWKPTDLDVGVGYVGVWRGVVPNYGASELASGDIDNTLHLGGAYFDLAYTLERRPYWRAWLAGRVEELSGHVNGQAITANGAAIRIAMELYSHAVGGFSDKNVVGFAAGTVAVGIYVEASHRTLPAELGPDAVTAGFSVRVPFVAALGG